jgi:DNA-binding NtrC family response regulator
METSEMRDFSQSAEKNSAARRVLVVDDEPLIRWSLSETLGERGFAVCQAGDARSARSAIADGDPFDVVLLDLRLPDSDDLTLLASIRRIAPLAQVILMTAFGRPDEISRALELGAYRVLSKPFELHAVADLVVQASTAGSRDESH